MKLELRRSKTGNKTVAEISDEIMTRRPALGDLFDISLSNGVTHSAKLLADGRSLLIDNKVIRFSTSLVQVKKDTYRIRLGGKENAQLSYHIQHKIVRPVEPLKSSATLGGGDLKSPMAGKVISVLVKDGDKVAEGATLCTIEAMKMENRITAECAGEIRNLKISPGQTISASDLMLTLTPSEVG